jgi:hypothetical protein
VAFIYYLGVLVTYFNIRSFWDILIKPKGIIRY